MTDKTKQPLTRSGFCQFPSTTDHAGCHRDGCTCSCHKTKDKP